MLFAECQLLQICFGLFGRQVGRGPMASLTAAGHSRVTETMFVLGIMILFQRDSRSTTVVTLQASTRGRDGSASSCTFSAVFTHAGFLQLMNVLFLTGQLPHTDNADALADRKGKLCQWPEFRPPPESLESSVPWRRPVRELACALFHQRCECNGPARLFASSARCRFDLPVSYSTLNHQNCANN